MDKNLQLILLSYALAVEKTNGTTNVELSSETMHIPHADTTDNICTL